MVLTTHLGTFDNFSGGFFQNRVFNLFSGTTGVNIFFTLSGFLITRLLYLEKTTFNTVSFKNFYARRFLRLLPPLLIFYTAIAVLMLLGTIPSTYKGFLLSFFYLYNFVFHQYYTPELGHTWSLAVEEQFYILWPFILGILSTAKSLLFASLLILLCAIALYMSNVNIGWPGHMHPLSAFYFFERGFIPAAAPIMVGCIASVLCLQYKNTAAALVAKYSIGILFLCVGLYTAPIWVPETMLPLFGIIQAVGIAIFIVWLLFNQQSVVCNILETTPLAYLGKISYGLYVYQGLFLTTGTNGKLAIQHFPQNVMLAFMCAVLSYEFMEKKVLKYKKNFPMQPAAAGDIVDL